MTDKFFNCGVVGGTVSAALARVVGAGANVVNMSFNDPGSQNGCEYLRPTPSAWTNRLKAGGSWLGRWATRLRAAQETTFDRRQPPKTRSLSARPITTRSVSWANNSTANTCAWNTFPSPAQDARRIPSYSAVWRQSPTPGSLVKPDLVAPGTRVTGPVSRGASPCGSALFCNANVASFTNPAVTYGMAAGTSFSTPAVTGAAAVVRRWYLNLKGASPSPAMTKAVLINGARDIAGTVVRNQTFGTPVATVNGIPDPFQGWGMLSLERLLGPASSYYFFDQGVSLTTAAPLWTKNLTVNNLAQDIHATLAWTEPPGTAGQNYTAMNNLKLLVCGPVNTQRCFQGNHFSPPANPGMPSFTPARPPAALINDTINNVERVRIQASYLTGTSLVVEVRAMTLAQSPQKFAVVIDNVHE